MFVKHQDENDKAQVITTAIEKCYIFDNAEVPLYPTLVKPIAKRYSTSSNIGKIASLVNYDRLISPFANGQFER